MTVDVVQGHHHTSHILQHGKRNISKQSVWGQSHDQGAVFHCRMDSVWCSFLGSWSWYSSTNLTWHHFLQPITHTTLDESLEWPESSHGRRVLSDWFSQWVVSDFESFGVIQLIRINDHEFDYTLQYEQYTIKKIQKYKVNTNHTLSPSHKFPKASDVF